jgi:hypothetical protein
LFLFCAQIVFLFTETSFFRVIWISIWLHDNIIETIDTRTGKPSSAKGHLLSWSNTKGCGISRSMKTPAFSANL